MAASASKARQPLPATPWPMRHRWKRLLVLAPVFAAIALSGCQDELLMSKAPLERAAEAGPRTVSTLFFINAGLDPVALEERLEDVLPNRMATVSQTLRSAVCLDVRGRERCGSARVRGQIERDGAIQIEGAGGTLIVRAPLRYSMSVRGRGRVRRYRDTVEGRAVAALRFAVTLDGEKDIDAALTDVSFETTTPTGSPSTSEPASAEVAIGKKSIDLAREIERRSGRQLRRAASAIQAAMDPAPALAILEQSWRKLHYPAVVAGEERVWLRAQPQSVYFAGLAGENRDLKLRFAVRGRLGRFEGEAPVPLIPVSLPKIKPLAEARAAIEVAATQSGLSAGPRSSNSRDVAGEDEDDDATAATVEQALVSRMVTTVTVPYDELVEDVRAALPERIVLGGEGAQPGAGEVASGVGTLVPTTVKLFPADRRVAVEIAADVEMNDDWSARPGRVYLAGLPQVARDAPVVTLGFIEMTTPISSPELFQRGAFIVPSSPLRSALEAGFRHDLRETFREVIAGYGGGVRADWDSDRDAFALVGTFDAVEVVAIEPGREGLTVVLNLVGDLSVREAGTIDATAVSSAVEATTTVIEN